MEICSPSWATKKNFKPVTFEDCVNWDSVRSIPFVDDNFIEWED